MCPVFKWLKAVWMPNGPPVFEWRSNTRPFVWILNGLGNKNHLNTGHSGSVLKWLLKIWSENAQKASNQTSVRISNSGAIQNVDIILSGI
jgi:hypothetical protein